MTVKNIKITGIKAAIGDFKKIIKRGNSYGFYMDITTGEVWCNEYASCTEWTQYNDQNIKSVKFDSIECDDETPLTMQTLRTACEYTINMNI